MVGTTCTGTGAAPAAMEEESPTTARIQAMGLYRLWSSPIISIGVSSICAGWKYMGPGMWMVCVCYVADVGEMV